jgi:chromosome segregation ATPase
MRSSDVSRPERTQDLYTRLEEVKQHYGIVQEKFNSVVQEQKPARLLRHRAKTSLKKVRYGIASSERQLKQLDSSSNMKDSTVRRRMTEIEHAISSYAKTLEEVEETSPLGEQDHDDKPRPAPKPEPPQDPPSTNGD